MLKVSNGCEQPIRITLLIEQQEVTMEVNTGASLSLINEYTLKRLGKVNRTCKKLNYICSHMLKKKFLYWEHFQ